MIQRGTDKIIKPKVLYAPLQQIIDEGRVSLYGKRLTPEQVAMFYLEYGYTGGKQNNHAAEKS